jgi:hypothetical protein
MAAWAGEALTATWSDQHGVGSSTLSGGTAPAGDPSVAVAA